MMDVIFVAGAYVAALGAIGGYALTLLRRLRAARSARAAIDAQRIVETGAPAQPQVP